MRYPAYMVSLWYIQAMQKYGIRNVPCGGTKRPTRWDNQYQRF